MIRSDPTAFRREFNSRAELEQLQRYRLQKQFQREKLKVESEAAEQEFFTVAQAVVQATIENISALKDDLTKYETLTVEEIMLLRERIDHLLEEREELLENAHVLPDGRRIFKTDNGQQVFDENGNEISRDVIDPNSIGNNKTRWEKFHSNTEKLESATGQLEENLEFLDEIEEIGTELDEENITDNKVEALKHRLERSVPTSIRIRQTALEAGGEPTKMKPDFAIAASNTVNLDTLEINAPGLGH